jgi:signal transduction histidine kinase
LASDLAPRFEVAVTKYASWTITLIAIAAALALATAESVAATAPKRIVFLHSYGQNFKPWSEYARALRQELDHRSHWPLVIEDFSVITARAEDENAEVQFVEYLSAVFSNQAPDMVVAFGAPAAVFVQRHRSDLFPATPMVLTAVDERRVQQLTLTGNDTVVAVRQNIGILFGHILQVLPDTKTIAVVVGNSPNERFWIGAITRELEASKDRVTLIFFNDLSFEEILNRAATLPMRTAIFWIQPQIDAIGAVHEGDSALTRLYAVANAPIFSYDDSFFGREIVGGPMTSVSAGTRAASDVAIRILSGEKPADIKTPVLEYGPAKYDWRQLQRWGISEGRLLPGSEIYFREPTAWERYRWQIALVGFVILLQATLITGLLYERRRRIYAEVQSRQRMAELAHVNRYSMAGELTASLAHELNQPLGAILTNAETLEVILKSPVPDMNELKEIAADIRRDDERASEVIRRLRSILRKTPFELRDFDLNEVVGETLAFVSLSAVARETELTSFLTSTALPIKGDRIQLEQVLLNLIVNAIDSTSASLNAERKVTVSTASIDGFAEVSVSDRGPGIQQDKLREVFEPFFTTKPKGMGMGLSIARTIVEAHGGRIWAENRTGGGATFRFRLPLVSVPKA